MGCKRESGVRDQLCGIVISNSGDLWDLSSHPHPKEYLDLEAQPIKTVYRIPGLGPQQLGTCQLWPIEGQRKHSS